MNTIEKLIAAYELQSVSAGVLIGGSVALILQGEMDKEPKDLDIICTSEKCFEKVVSACGLTESDKQPSANPNDSCPAKSYTYNGVHVDIFIRPDAEVCDIRVMGYTTQEPDQIWQAKREYAERKSKKHVYDVSCKDSIVDDHNTLPF